MDGGSPMGTAFAVDRIAERGSWAALYASVRERNPDASEEAFDGAWQKLFADLSRCRGRLERFLILDDARLASLGCDGTIGRHWSTDGSELYVDALYVPDEADDSWNTYLVTGSIPSPDAIDWVETLRMRIDLPWENEVVLREEADVRINAICLYLESQRAPVTRVRTDLEGTTLRAAVPADAAPCPAR